MTDQITPCTRCGGADALLCYCSRPRPAADVLRTVTRTIAAYRSTDPHYADPLGVTLENAWTAALDRFFRSGGTREEADRIEDEAFAGVDGTGRFIG